MSTVPLKGKLPPSHETRLVSLETRFERNETSLVSRECTGSTNTLLSSIYKPVLCIIVPICAVTATSILISDACVPCVYYKFISVHQYCFICIGQTFFNSCQIWPYLGPLSPLESRHSNVRVCQQFVRQLCSLRIQLPINWFVVLVFKHVNTLECESVRSNVVSIE